MKLIIAEKPSVASEIAKVVGANKNEKDYLTGNDYIVSWCVGHLIELAEPEEYSESLQKWTIETLPIIPEHYLTTIAKSKSERFHVLKKLMERADVTELIEATDAGREGELIFRLVYEKAGCKKPFKRLWISSMEEKSIRSGLANMKPGSAYDNLYLAALCRQRADWLVGINLTRLYTTMYHQKLTCGRVQTPTINLIVKRQREITAFTPATYFSMIADCGNFKAHRKATEKGEAELIISRCSGQKATVTNVESQEKKENPAALYDLTTLQRDANRLLGYSAKQTLDYMQNLYDSKLATYPRTDSRYITADQEGSTRDLIDTLLSSGIYSSTIESNYRKERINMQRIINDQKVTDHHAIIPTCGVTKEKFGSLPTGEKNILFLIAYRLLSAVYDAHSYTATKIELEIAGKTFTATGRVEIDSGFKMIDDEIKKAALFIEDKEEKERDLNIALPELRENQKIPVIKITAEERKTQPPKPYTEDTLLAAMETAGKDIADQELREAIKDSGLGTPATRAGIIENIIKTGYIKRDGKKLIPTETAFTFVDLVTEKVKEPELTAEWEKRFTGIQKGMEKQAEFMDDITAFLRSIITTEKRNYSPEKSADAFPQVSFGICPICGKRVLEYPKSYSCEKWKDGCGFKIWKSIAGKTITPTQAKKLIAKGKSDLIQGFKSKKDGQPEYPAYLILKEDKSVGFEFTERK